VAVQSEDGCLTYEQLNTRANRLARVLAGRGAGPESVVATVMARSAEVIVTVLAVLQAGAAYLPVDPGYPRARIGYMLADARPAVIVAADLPAPIGTAVLTRGARRLGVELAAAAAGDLTDADRTGVLSVLSATYVIDTSGSTGTPKGGLPHRGDQPGREPSGRADRSPMVPGPKLVCLQIVDSPRDPSRFDEDALNSHSVYTYKHEQA
jgi:non-ribosomal peptide synthetase component F